MNTKLGNMLVEEIAPRLASMVPKSVKPFGAEDAEELVQDGTAIAAGILASCARKRRRVTAGNVAHYVMLLLRSGRRSTGSVRTDPLSPFTRMLGRTTVVSFEEPSDPADCASPKIADLLAEDNEDPAGRALRAVDWEDLQTSLPPLERAALEALAEGRCLSATARKNGVCPSTMSTAKRKLAVRIREAWGADAIAEAARKPGWRADLRAEKERREARRDRAAAVPA